MARYWLTLLATLWLFSHQDLGAEIVELKNATSFDTKLIVGGTTTNISYFPFQVSMYLKKEFWCGGSILSKTWVITAAHCVQKYPTQPKFYKLRMNSSYHAKYGRRIKISSIYLHPKYNQSIFDYDVALLNISGNKLKNKSLHPIKLPAAQAPIPVGMHLNVSGWGETKPGRDSHILRYATVDAIAQEKCFEVYGDGHTDAMFCAAAPGKDHCQGDSGGPIQTDNILYGVISSGTSCASPEDPGVYTRLAFPEIRNWIRSLTGL